jgi:magnesium-transporting ATPase (P-type)
MREGWTQSDGDDPMYLVERKKENEKLRKSMNKFGLKLIQIYLLVSIIFFLYHFFHETKHIIKLPL